MKVGPNIEDDGLVLSIDASNIRSFRGVPTTNYFSNVDIGTWTVESGASRISTNETYKGQPVYLCRTNLSLTYLSINTTSVGTLRTDATGQSITFSIYVKNENDTSEFVSAFIGHDFASGRTIPANSDWQRISWTVLASNVLNDNIEFRPQTGAENQYLKFTMPQVEIGTSPTEFTEGTRGSTVATGGGVIDLSPTNGNTALSNTFTANLSYFKFTNNPQNQLQHNTPITLGSSWNVSTWIYLDSPSDTYYHILTESSSQSNFACKVSRSGLGLNAYFFRTETGSIASTSEPLLTGRWYHLVYDYDGTTLRIYFNGVVKGSANTTMNIPSYTYVTNGGHLSEFENYRISNLKVYNRSLTQEEIQQNFNALRGKFGL